MSFGRSGLSRLMPSKPSLRKDGNPMFICTPWAPSFCGGGLLNFLMIIWANKLVNSDLDRFVNSIERNRPFVYIEQVLDL